LKKAGYRTGLFISPYIMKFNERMQVNGEYITDDELVELTDEIRPFADVMIDSPTEFELVTALAMQFFLKRECDIVVLEVGMGGRMDSTNVIETPELAVITSIGYDHVAELGPTISDIAGEKAGIIKSGGDVVVYGGDATVVAVFNKVASDHGARLQKVDFSRILSRKFSLEGVQIDIRPYGEIMLPLAGAYQPYNATLAITALEKLRDKGYKISDSNIVKGLESVSWPGRFEILGRNPTFILDGSHNPQGMEATAESLRSHFADQKIIFVVGVMADKDIDAMMAHVAPLAKVFMTVKPNHERAMESSALAERLKCFDVPAIDCGLVKKGITEALKMAGENDVVCALGSLYFSSEVREAYNARG